MKTQILTPTPDQLLLAAEALRNDQIVAVPTETVYGLAARAHSPVALARVFDAKERPHFDPLIVHVGITSQGLMALQDLRVIEVRQLSSTQVDLLEPLIAAFWPGPLTLVLPKHPDLPDLVTSGLPTVAVRLPRHPVMLALLALLGEPLAAPSANRFGQISPTRAADVYTELHDRIPYILDGDACEIGVESTIVRVWDSGEISILRHGGITQEQIAEALKSHFKDDPEKQNSFFFSAAKAPSSGKNSSSNIVAPGMLEKHYAPTKPFILLPQTLNQKWSTTEKASLAAALSRAQTEGSKKQARIALLRLTGDPMVGLLSLKQIFNEFFSKQSDEMQGTSNPPMKQSTEPYTFESHSLSIQNSLAVAAHELYAQMRKLDLDPTVDIILCEPCPSQEGLGAALSDRIKRASAEG